MLAFSDEEEHKHTQRMEKTREKERSLLEFDEKYACLYKNIQGKCDPPKIDKKRINSFSQKRQKRVVEKGDKKINRFISCCTL